MTNLITIEVAYATNARQKIVELNVLENTTLEQAVTQSKINFWFPELDLSDTSKLALGVFGKQKPNDSIVKAGDRIEIYRPLIADPKESRRKRAEKKETKNSV